MSIDTRINELAPSTRVADQPDSRPDPRRSAFDRLPRLREASIADGMFVIAPPAPNVYAVIAGTRRGVPDPTTLMAIAPRGWESVLTVTEAAMVAVPEGPVLPSREDNRIYLGDQAPEVYVVQGLQRHHIPDPDTLEQRFGGWAGVVQVSTADLEAIPLGSPIPSVHDTDTIDGYLRSLPDFTVQPPTERHDPIAGTTPQMVGGITYDVTREHASITTQNDRPWLLAPMDDVLYPGALLQGTSLATGRLAGLPGGLARGGGTITVTTDLATEGPPRSASADLAKMGLSEVKDARVQLLHDLNPKDGAAKVEFAHHSVRTTEHGLVKLGVSFSYGPASADIKSSLDTRLDQSSVMVMYRQIFYSVAFTVPDGVNPFFAPDVTLDRVRAVIGAANPPVYLSQVDYGRILLVTITGTKASSELLAAVSVAVEKASKTAPGGKVDLSAEQRNTLESSSIKVTVAGGTGEAANRVVTDPIANLTQWINSGGTLTRDNPGVPVQYVARHCGTRNVVAINQTTAYEEAVAAQGRDVSPTPFEVWDGPGGGPKSTNILIANGDTLQVRAKGTNWSGVWLTDAHGPDGWTTWNRPGGNGEGYPMPNKHPFALLGAWDGAQTDANAGNDWFYIGGGVDLDIRHKGSKPARTLWLGTNDNNPLNGSARDKFSVVVSVRRRVLDDVRRAQG